MSDLARQRRSPFVVVAAVVMFVTVAVFRLPDSLVAQIQNSGPLSLSERGWAYRLLALIAVLQVLYVGFSLLRPERVGRAREKDERIGRMSRAEIVRSLARSAAGAVLLTLIYGVAAFAASGFRAGFWLFTGLCLIQGAWYYRQTGEVAKWLAFQPETSSEPGGVGRWVAAPPDYVPPIARTLQPLEVGSPPRE